MEQQIQPIQPVQKAQPAKSSAQVSKQPVATQPTQQAKPVQQVNTQSDEPTEEEVQSNPSKWYSKWWLWVIIAAVILLGFGIWYFFL